MRARSLWLHRASQWIVANSAVSATGWLDFKPENLKVSTKGTVWLQAWALMEYTSSQKSWI